MLRKRGKQLLKVVHVVCAGAWLGALAAIVLLSLAGSADKARFGVDLAIYRIHDVILFWAFVGTLVTGLVFSLFTPWGFMLHRWIAAKWLLAIALFTVTLFAQSPAVSGMVGLSDAGVSELDGMHYDAFAGRSATLALVQLAIVIAVFAISTLKPWGKRARDVALNRKVLVGVVVGGGALATAFGAYNAYTLARYRTMAIEATGPVGVPDGRYRGEARCGVAYAVDVVIRDQHLAGVDVADARESHYARIARAVTARIVSAQSPAVDAITGATTSSKCLMKATANALATGRARGLANE